MKRIGILTFHRSVNNGAVMQAYSLSKRIASEFPETKVEIIDYHMKKIDEYYQYTFSKYIKSDSIIIKAKKCAKLILDPTMIRRLNNRTTIFYDSINNLPLSETKIISDSADELYNYINSSYDVVIVGSDAVWNHIVRGFPNPYLPDMRVHCRKMSYAASCYGMDFLKCTASEKEAIGKSLNDFSFVGVRDDATEDFVKWSGSKSVPIHTCDPTAFLDIRSIPVNEKDLKQKLAKRGFDFSKPTIGMMGNEKMCSMIRSMYGKRYQIVALYVYVKKADVNLYDLTPYEWAYVFRYFKLLFTTYFHGTLLALRNGVPLICISLNNSFEQKHKAKALDILERVGYSDWYFFTDYNGLNYNEIKEKADELLSSNIKEEIIFRIDEEAKSFENFNIALKKIINLED